MSEELWLCGQETDGFTYSVPSVVGPFRDRADVDAYCMDRAWLLEYMLLPRKEAEQWLIGEFFYDSVYRPLKE